jgi:hypothetical protein
MWPQYRSPLFYKLSLAVKGPLWLVLTACEEQRCFCRRKVLCTLTIFAMNIVAYRDPLLDNDSETNIKATLLVDNRKYTHPLVCNVFANKHVPTTMNSHTTIEESLETMLFCTVRVEIL